MFNKKGVLLILIVLIFLPLSCANIEDQTVPFSGDLITKALPSSDSIPLEYGKLVSVSSMTGYPYWVQLWFEDESGTIRMVRYSIRENSFAENSHLIPRK